MRGSTLAWCNKHGVPNTSAVLDISTALPGWSHLPPFTVRDYFAAVSAGLDDIDARWSRTTAFISEWRQYWKPSDTDSEATMQSYLRQEAEAVSLRAKLHVTSCLSSIGVQAINLQHDGLVVRPGRSNAETLRRFFTAKSSQALCYPQPVEVKPMEASIPTTPSSARTTRGRSDVLAREDSLQEYRPHSQLPNSLELGVGRWGVG